MNNQMEGNNDNYHLGKKTKLTIGTGKLFSY